MKERRQKSNTQQMNIQANEYNPIQLNENITYSSDGKILSKSLMLNLRGESIQDVWGAYRELKKLVSNGEDTPKSDGAKVQLCDCGNPMILRTGRLVHFLDARHIQIAELLNLLGRSKRKKL